MIESLIRFSLGLILAVIQTLAVMSVYNWTISPLYELPQLSFMQVFCALILYGYISHTVGINSDSQRNTMTEWLDIFLYYVTLALVFVLLGLTLTLFI
jgi:hypothetical protein